MQSEVVATFSIAGRDPATGELGVAVQSKFLAVGAVVPWVRASAGAIATQAWANTAYGPEGLALLEQGLSAGAVIEHLTAADAGRDFRQLGVVDARGGTATYTGSKCNAWAGGVAGENFCAQGNILTGPEVVAAMATAFPDTAGDLAARLVAALEAGQQAGGDSRGRQSAALYIAKPAAGYGGFSDRFIDLRVDDHPEPIRELARLLLQWRLYFEKPRPGTALPIAGTVRVEVTLALQKLGYLPAAAPGWEELRAALRRFIHQENFEEKELPGDLVDPQVLAFLRQKAG